MAHGRSLNRCGLSPRWSRCGRRKGSCGNPTGFPQSRRQGLARGAGLQGHRGRRAPRRRHRRGLQHRLLVRDQHQPPALLGRAAPVVLQPARRHRLAACSSPRPRAWRSCWPSLRGLRGDKHLGDFYLDLMRSLVFVFVPAVRWSSRCCWSATGMPMTFEGAAQATTLDGAADQDGDADDRPRARWPRWWRSSRLGTNGGGFFGPNSAHPFENPSPWSNLIEVVAIVVLPMSSIVMAGLMLKNRAARGGDLRRDAGLPGGRRRRGHPCEVQPSAATDGLPVARAPNMEGKEVRVGPGRRRRPGRP